VICLFADERWPDMVSPEDGVITYSNRQGFNQSAIKPAARAYPRPSPRAGVVTVPRKEPTPEEREAQFKPLSRPGELECDDDPECFDERVKR
jgi:hypothetical protein